MMRPHLYMQHGFWKVRAKCPDITLGFSTREGAFRWAARIYDGN